MSDGELKRMMSTDEKILVGLNKRKRHPSMVELKDDENNTSADHKPETFIRSRVQNDTFHEEGIRDSDVEKPP